MILDSAVDRYAWYVHPSPCPTAESGFKLVSEEILINVTPQETRVAVVENGVLQEVHIERARTRGIVGNIYKGRVVRVLPGMQAAFVDIDLERTAFLHAGDVLPRGTVDNNGNHGNDQHDDTEQAPTVEFHWLVIF